MQTVQDETTAGPSRPVPLLSIVVPAYNADGSIAQCLDSVMGEDVDGIEVVVVDDGSTDGTAALCDRYAREHPETIRVIHQENAGPSAARNSGILASSGEWLLMLDADDHYTEGALSTIVGELRPDRDCVMFPVEVLSQQGTVVREPCVFDCLTDAKGMARIILAAKGQYQGYICNKCIRASIVRDGRVLLDDRYTFCEDEEWWLRVAARAEELRPASDGEYVRVLPLHLYRYDQTLPGLRATKFMDARRSARTQIVRQVTCSWPDLAQLAQVKHAVWQNACIKRAAKVREPHWGSFLREVYVPEYRRAFYRSSEFGLATKLKSRLWGAIARLAILCFG